MARIALITGIAGQDGYYLSEFLRYKGYDVVGIEAPGKHVPEQLCERLYYVDMGRGVDPATGTDMATGTNRSTRFDLAGILNECRPDEVYNLAGLSRVSSSFEDPVAFANVNGVGAVRLLEAIRNHQDRTGREVRFYQASSSEMYGSVGQSPPNEATQNESTPFHPRSPYGCAKLFAHMQTINYREAFGLFACSGILFNHESPRRNEHFVTRKITSGAARIKLGLDERITLGNIDAQRDWGFAGDYVEAMWLMLQQEWPDDYVIATGEMHSVREFGEVVFSYLGLDWARHVEIDPALFRPAEIKSVCGDASKAHRVLGWRPRVTFRELACMMADYDLQLLKLGSGLTSAVGPELG